MSRTFTIEELKATAGHRGVREDGAGRVAVWNRRTETWNWYSPTPEGYRLSGSTEALGRATTRYPTAAGRIARRIARRKVAILAPASDGGKQVRRHPSKPIPVSLDAADQDGVPEVTCPRCKGHGATSADKDYSCNLCDGEGKVFDHGDGTYSNRIDKARYYW
jgi:hypothetical protein